MATAVQLQDAYIDYVLTHNEQPKSVYAFAKNIGVTEQEFYDFYSSFTAIEKDVWYMLTVKAIEQVQQQEIWATYTSREKILSFFYAYIELLKTQRSFIVYSLRRSRTHLSTPEVLDNVKNVFQTFAENVIQTGLESGELADRRYLSKRYKNALWIQFGIIINFWISDSSKNFEKTDEAIERGVNVTFDLFQRSPLDDIFEYGKFVIRNGRFKEKMRF